LNVRPGDEEKGVLPTLARLGGDEFTVLLEELNDVNVAGAVAERLQHVLRRPMMIEGQLVHTTASMGIAVSTADYASAADMMRDADLAMYRAKSEGPARVEIFDQSLHERAIRRLSVENDLRSALQKNEFVLHYQPIVALNSGIVVGFEALVRWQRGSGQLVPPCDFIGVAEETGLIVAIGNWVMRQAFTTIAAWHRAYPWPAPLTMSVNVSPRQFDQPDFVEQVIAAVKDSGARPETIRLEITESVALNDPGRAILILERLHEFGVRVSVDDFGTGYSSLSYLQQLPFDTLKIDRSFVNALQEKTERGDLIRTILDLARNLNMEVVAEGVETREQVEQLRNLGCGFAQGYYFSRPLAQAGAAKLLAQPKRLLP
jgi:predicted signal transduction protein with EAL and GGDEF domain